MTTYLEDGTTVSKWLGSPPFKSHLGIFRPFGKGPITPVRGLKLTMVINHLLAGMILRVPSM